MTSCPHCKCPFTDAEILAIRQSYASRQRKTRSGGRNGGRPKLTPEQMREAARIGSPIMAQAVSDAFDKVHGRGPDMMALLAEGARRIAAVAQPYPKPEAEASVREHSYCHYPNHHASMCQCARALTYEPMGGE